MIRVDPNSYIMLCSLISRQVDLSVISVSRQVDLSVISVSPLASHIPEASLMGVASLVRNSQTFYQKILSRLVQTHNTNLFLNSHQ